MSLRSTLVPIIRRLGQTPGFSVVTVLTLALGIAGTTAAFSVVNAVLLRPLPYRNPDRLVGLWHTAPGLGIRQVEQSDASYIQYHDRATRSFESLASYRAISATLTGGQEPEQVPSAEITASLLPTLGVAPMLGRAIRDEEDRPGAPRVVLLSHALWQRRFGGDGAIVGRTIQLDGEAREVIGVMPPTFRFPSGATQLWTPMAIDRAALNNANFNRIAIGRLRPNVTLAAAAAELQPLLMRLPEDVPGMLTRAILEQAQIRAYVRPLREDVVGDIGPILFTVLGTVGVVLLIACANVANLLLVRAEARAREMAVRTALGATPGRIARLYLAESLMLALAGAALGVGFAYGALRVLLRLAPDGLPRAEEIGIDLSSFVVAAVIAVSAGIFFGALPFFRAARAQLSPMLRDGSRGATTGRERHRLRNGLVVGQVALALVLLVGSGLLARSFQRMRAVDPGFDPNGVLTLRLSLPGTTYRTAGDLTRFYQQLVDRVAALPGVRAAGVTSKLPLSTDGSSKNGVWVEDRPLASDGVPSVHPTTSVTTGYFTAMGIPIVEGRVFHREDGVRLSHEVIVGRAFARRYWPNESAIGKRVKTGGPEASWSTIVGVVGDVHDEALTSPADEMIYRPLLSVVQPQPGLSDTLVADNYMALTVRTAGDPTAVFPAVRREIWAMDRNLPLINVRPLTDVVSAAMARTTFTMIMLGAAAGVALLLGAIGIYGVISYMVSLRAREIGVRMALGAHSAQVRGMVVRQGLTLAGIGAGIGLVAAVGVSRLIASLLYGIAPHDPVTLAVVTVALLGIAALASWLPAVRAARIDPVEALRRE